MGVRSCVELIDDEALARPSQAFRLLCVGEIPPEAYPLWIVDECHRTRRSEYRRRLSRRRSERMVASVRSLLIEMRLLIQAGAEQRYFDPIFGFGVCPALAFARAIA